MIGQMIKYARTKANLTQEELGKLVNTNRTTIGNYETGFRQPTFEMIEELLNKCGYEIVFKSKNETIKLKDVARKL